MGTSLKKSFLIYFISLAGIIHPIYVFSAGPVTIKKTVSAEEGIAEMEYTLPSGQTMVYRKPGAFHFMGTLPKDYKSYCKKTFRESQLVNFGFIAGSTLMLYAFDDQLLRGAKSFGRTVHLAGTSNQTALIDEKVRIGKQDVKLEFNVPTDLNSSMYFLGDGWTHTTIALSYWVTGLITHDYRALQTASQLGECILATGIATQVIKHITGRESPFTTNVPRGTWRFFPNQKEYAAHTPSHDAYPTGHLATAMATVTVIADNYPEKKYIRPLGYSLMGLLGFAMMNNGVHWASDYPLGIALGYSFAKIATTQGRKMKEPETEQPSSGYRWKLKSNFYPAVYTNQAGIGVRWMVMKKYFR